MDVHSPAVGFLQVLYNPGDEVPVGGLLGRIYQDASRPPGHPEKDSAPGAANSLAAHQERIYLPLSEDGNSIPGGEPLPRSTGLPKVESKGDETASSSVRHLVTKRFSKRALDLLDRHKINPALFDDYALVRSEDVLKQVSQEPKPSGI